MDQEGIQNWKSFFFFFSSLVFTYDLRLCIESQLSELLMITKLLN